MRCQVDLLRCTCFAAISLAMLCMFRMLFMYSALCPSCGGVCLTQPALRLVQNALSTWTACSDVVFRTCTWDLPTTGWQGHPCARDDYVQTKTCSREKCLQNLTESVAFCSAFAFPGSCHWQFLCYDVGGSFHGSLLKAEVSFDLLAPLFGHLSFLQSQERSEATQRSSPILLHALQLGGRHRPLLQPERRQHARTRYARVHRPVRRIQAQAADTILPRERLCL